jgi:KRAB domain-containing zinc finger protein
MTFIVPAGSINGSVLFIPGWIFMQILKTNSNFLSGMKLFECDVCKVKFSTNHALKEHMSRHTDTRPHDCNICQKSFRQLSCLSRHLTTHSDEKRYQCDLCTKKFSQMAYLKSHKRSHTGSVLLFCHSFDC